MYCVCRMSILICRLGFRVISRVLFFFSHKHLSLSFVFSGQWHDVCVFFFFSETDLLVRTFWTDSQRKSAVKIVKGIQFLGILEVQTYFFLRLTRPPEFRRYTIAWTEINYGNELEFSIESINCIYSILHTSFFLFFPFTFIINTL